jgi:TatD DNase family protein
MSEGRGTGRSTRHSAPAPPLFDCHSHLDRYPSRTLTPMLTRAVAAGVGAVITAGTDPTSSGRCVALAARHELLRAGVGLHPNRVLGPAPERTYAALDELAAAPAVVVWSECGLDYRDGPAPPAVQRAAFERQLALARAHGLAAIVHVVDAADDALAILRATGMAARSAIHYFVGDPALAERYLTAGLYLSVGKPVIRQEHAALRDAVRRAPLDRLLVETDTYPLPGRATEPADVARVAATLAELRGATLAAVVAATGANLAGLLGPTRWPAITSL